MDTFDWLLILPVIVAVVLLDSCRPIWQTTVDLSQIWRTTADGVMTSASRHVFFVWGGHKVTNPTNRLVSKACQVSPGVYLMGR